MHVKLPFPPSSLVPHAGGHWGKKAGATKKYRKLCADEAVAQGVRHIQSDCVNAVVTFYPPNRRMDRQNREAAFKAGIDGLADALGVDDRYWRVEWQHEEPCPPYGYVVVEIAA